MVLAVWTAGCSSYGPPKLADARTTSAMYALGDCKLVERPMRDEYVTHLYLSTWASTFREGATAGVHETLSDPENAGITSDTIATMVEAAAADNPWPTTARTLDASDRPLDAVAPFPREPYCKVYKHAKADVSRQIENLLPLLGNETLVQLPDRGFFQTRYLQRHAPKPFNVIWRDRYTIAVSELGDSQAVVRVHRDLYISRESNGQGDRLFTRATSVGHNEAWILLKIQTLLNSKNPN